MNDASAELKQLSQQVEQLQRERRDLQQQIASREQQVARHRQLITDLSRGVWHGGRGRKRRFLVWLVLGLVLGGGVFGFLLVNWTMPGKGETFALGTERLKPYRPHLLITSAPTPIALFIDGEAKGKTPHLFRSPTPTGTYVVEVRAPGYKPMRKTLQVTERGGSHWHAVLYADPSAGQPASRPSR